MKTHLKRMPKLPRSFCCALLAMILTWQSVGVAQEKPHLDRSDEADQFRKAVVEKWKWKPQQGVSLTTTAYARAYVSKRYFDDRGKFPKQYAVDGRVKIGDIADASVVLFQTIALDIVVVPDPTYNSHHAFAVLRRSGRELLYAGFAASTTSKPQARFIDVDGDAPLELEIQYAFQDPGRYGVDFAIHDLTDDFRELFRFRSLVDEELCPSLQYQGVPTPELDARSSRVKVLTGRIEANLRLNSSCSRSEHTTAFDLRCTFDAEQKSFSCKRDFVKKAKLEPNALDAADEEQAAANVEFVSKNAKKLRESGFAIPETLPVKDSSTTPSAK